MSMELSQTGQCSYFWDLTEFLCPFYHEGIARENWLLTGRESSPNHAGTLIFLPPGLWEIRFHWLQATRSGVFCSKNQNTLRKSLIGKTIHCILYIDQGILINKNKISHNTMLTGKKQQGYYQLKKLLYFGY